VLKWILERVEGRGSALETPIGYVPGPGGLTLDGLQLAPGALDELMRVDPDDWQWDLQDSRQFFDKFGNRLPPPIRDEHSKLSRRLEHALSA
jgi:phosphoenolpyruvate carboxykinase (GTP)